VILHVLPGGEVAFAARALVGDGSHLPHLARGKQAARDLGADHLDAFLALAIDPAAKPERPEFVGGQLACEEVLGLRPEQFDVFANGPIVFLLKELLVYENIRGSHTLIPYRDYTTSPPSVPDHDGSPDHIIGSSDPLPLKS
jgi:hypothetical protein